MPIFKQNLHLGTKDPLIQTDDISDDAVAFMKLSPEVRKLLLEGGSFNEKYVEIMNILNKCNFDYAYKVLTYAEYKVIAHDPKTIYFITDQITDDI